MSNMSLISEEIVSSDISDVSSCSSQSNDSQSSEDEVFLSETQFVPYQDEPLADSDEENDETSDEENDLDGLTQSVLVARLEQKIKLDSW